MSVKESLAEYLRKKKNESEEKKVDWQHRRNQWLEALEALYKDIHTWLQEAIDEKIVTTDYRDITLDEEYIGTYSARTLTLHIGLEKVVFEPQGALILGASGRVDVKGRGGPVTIVLLDKKWNIATKEVPRRHWPLNKDSFDDLLRQVME